MTTIATTHHVRTVTRETQEAGLIYVGSCGTVFYTPDGIGRYYYGTVREAKVNHADANVGLVHDRIEV